eukprot:556538-Prymnesium_polylepis.1
MRTHRRCIRLASAVAAPLLGCGARKGHVVHPAVIDQAAAAIGRHFLAGGGVLHEVEELSAADDDLKALVVDH